MTDPWEECSVWKTKANYFTWLRGALRKIWSDYPLRKEWKKEALRPVTADEKRRKLFHPSTKNVGMCSFCHEWFPGSKLEVDHKLPSTGCHDYKTAEQFLWHCARLTGDKFQLACVPCHKIKSHADSNGMIFEEAKFDKEVIAFCKQPIKTQEAFFRKHKADPFPTNAKTRRASYIAIAKKRSK